MATTPLAPRAAQIAFAEARSASLSASTTARYRQARDGFIVAKEQAIRDAASNPNLKPQEMMDTIVKIQGMHAEIEKFTNEIATTASAEITPTDASVMKQMRAEGATDAKIADWYDTNPTKVNRMINGS